MKTQIITSTLFILVYGISTALACSGCGCSSKSASACSHSQHAQVPTIVETAQKAGKFGTLVAALQAADLVDALQGPGPFTVFAPTDKAFAALPEGTVESLLLPENKAKLQTILKYHVVAGKVMSTDIIKYNHAKTLHGDKVDLTLMINNARVVKTDIKASNGIVHVIDQVILPDQAKPIKGYANGESSMQPNKSIVQTAVEAGQFNTLVTAIKAAGLVDALNGAGPFTVFAPTDAAFAKLPAGTVESLVQPENKAKLQGILKYHVVPAKLSSQDIVTSHTVKTLSGQAIYPSLLVDDASIKVKNIYCRNGVIHVINDVILPTDKT